MEVATELCGMGDTNQRVVMHATAVQCCVLQFQ